MNILVSKNKKDLTSVRSFVYIVPAVQKIGLKTWHGGAKWKNNTVEDKVLEFINKRFSIDWNKFEEYDSL